MEQQARCKKCGRILRSLQSIALGMGGTCAGEQPGSRKRSRIRAKAITAKGYPSSNSGRKGVSIVGDLSSKPLNKSEAVCRIREERRQLFEQRQPFQCGVLAGTQIPVIYIPLVDGSWMENHSGRTIPHEKLQAYLKQYRLI